VFDETYREQGNWRIKSNPLSWGGENPTVVVLGFSKGPTQAGALVRSHHDQIAYKGSRENVGKILRRIGLLPKSVNDKYAQKVDDLISDKDGMFHFGSLIRCTVEQFTETKGWIGSGGGMLDKFVATYFGNEVTGNCASSFLADMPASVKLVVMFGLGTGKNYVRASRKLIEKARNTEMKWINDVSYSDDEIVVVHVEHFAAQGSLIPQWLGDGEYKGCERSRLSALAIQGVSKALSR
jgi:hypothetical protein